MNKSFECRYSMYLHHKGVKSRVSGSDIIDAIKKSNPNAILVYVVDEDGTEYFVKEHDEVDSRGYCKYYWVDKNDKVLYDENDSNANPAPEKPKPIYIGKTTTESGWIDTNGKFYECGVEQHSSFADYIMETGVIPNVKYSNAEKFLEKRKWVKLSDGEIRYSFKNLRDTISKKQKETIVDYFTKKNKRIKVLGKHFSVLDFYEL